MDGATTGGGGRRATIDVRDPAAYGGYAGGGMGRERRTFTSHRGWEAARSACALKLSGGGGGSSSPAALVACVRSRWARNVSASLSLKRRLSAAAAANAASPRPMQPLSAAGLLRRGLGGERGAFAATRGGKRRRQAMRSRSGGGAASGGAGAQRNRPLPTRMARVPRRMSRAGCAEGDEGGGERWSSPGVGGLLHSCAQRSKA